MWLRKPGDPWSSPTPLCVIARRETTETGFIAVAIHLACLLRSMYHDLHAACEIRGFSNACDNLNGALRSTCFSRLRPLS